MASGVLYTYPNNFRVHKILITAKYSKADVSIHPDFVFDQTNKSKSFLSKFKSSKVPAFEAHTDSGAIYLQESNAICYYLANDELKGGNKSENAQVYQWMCFAESEVLPAACAWVFPILGVVHFDPMFQKATERAQEDVKHVLSTLDSHLLTRTYLVGERITLADIVVATTLLNLYKYALDSKFRKPYTNVNRWFTTMVNQVEFKEVIGDVQFLDKPIEIGTSPETSPPSCPVKKPEKQEKEKKAYDDQPSASPPPVVDEPLDPSDEAIAAEPISKNPFDQMPKSTFNFEDFKRFYSNNDEDKSIPYFWKKFDPANNSIWYSEYKYANELTKKFMSCNLISGMYQRLDKMRKGAFASVCLFGEDNDSTISGIWVWKGHDLAFTLSPDWQVDYESYEWKKLDPNDEGTKKLVDQYFRWVGTDKNGRKFVEGKVFK